MHTSAMPRMACATGAIWNLPFMQRMGPRTLQTRVIQSRRAMLQLLHVQNTPLLKTACGQGSQVPVLVRRLTSNTIGSISTECLLDPLTGISRTS